METNNQNLLSALSLRSKEHVALVGGGGKSTLSLKMSEALVKDGARVVSSTTTKVRETEATAYPRLLLFSFGEVEQDSVSAELDDVENVFVARAFLENGKVDGIPPAWADDLFRMPGASYVIIEADGAAGRPLKAPAAHEPVIPESVTTVIALMGLKVLGEPLGPDTVFRPALFKALTGLKDGDILNPERLVRAFDQKAGLFRNAPVSARKIVFLNQLDRLTDERPAHHLAQLLLTENPFIERVVLGSCQQNTFITIHRGRV